MLLPEEMNQHDRIHMLFDNAIARDALFDVKITTTNGRVKHGNSRRYFVDVLVGYHTRGYVTRCYETRFGFRAGSDREAVEKFKKDKRTDVLYRDLWQSAMNDYMAIG